MHYISSFSHLLADTQARRTVRIPPGRLRVNDTVVRKSSVAPGLMLCVIVFIRVFMIIRHSVKSISDTIKHAPLVTSDRL